MTNQPNPYQPSHEIEPYDTWWSKFRRRITGKRVFGYVREPVFSAGGKIHFSGIVYYLFPKDRSVFYAASPSNEHSVERLELIAEESLRLLPDLLSEHPGLKATLQGRRMVVRTIESYASKRSDFLCEMEVDANKVAAAFLASNASAE